MTILACNVQQSQQVSAKMLSEISDFKLKSSVTASRYVALQLEPLASQQTALSDLFQSMQPKSTPKGMLPNARSRSEDLVSLLIIHLLRREAVRLGASCLLTGETSTRMAVKLIDSIGKGQGHKLPLEQSAIRWHGLFILKPMKEVSRKEVEYYTRQKKLVSLTSLDIIASQLLSSGDGISGANGDKASMGRLTDSLIHLLERNVASTVSTINKAGDKLVFSDEAAADERIEDEVDINASSSTAFIQVGPSVSLRQRRRQDSTSTQMSKLSFGSSHPARLDGSTVGEPGDRTLQGLGLGRMGSTLYFAAKKMLPYKGELACPLCQMPSQRCLHAWKRGLTVQRNPGNSDKAREKLFLTDRVDLSKYLCYGCALILDTPENVQEGAMMVLPSFVLVGVQDRMHESISKAETNGHTFTEPNGHVDASTEPLPALYGDHKEQNGRGMQKVERSEMRRHLSGFLLNDDETIQTPTSQQERQQMDW